MQLINKLERLVLGWVKDIPHLPVVAQKWLATNVWWIVLIGAIMTGLAALFTLVGLTASIAILGSPSNAYYVAGSTYASWAIVTSAVNLFFFVIGGIILAAAVKPLKEVEKKGWVLLFLAWLVHVASVVVGAVLSLSVLGFILNIIFGAIGIAITGYFLFEIHSQFAHVVRKAPKASESVKTV